MLRAQNSQTRRVSGETGHSLSPKPTLRSEQQPESLEVPVLQKSASVPSSPQDVPHNSGATWERLPLVPQPREGAPVVAKQSSHDGGSWPSSRSFPEEQSSAGGEGEPPTMGSMFTEWIQKLFAPHDGASSSSGAGAGVDAATGSKGGGHASSLPVVDRAVQAKDVRSNGRSGIPGNGAGGTEETSEDTDVPSNKTSRAMTDAKPPSPAGANESAAAHVQGYRPTHPEKHKVSAEESSGTNVSLPSSSAFPPSSTADVASTGVVTTAAASGASHSSSRPPAIDAGDASNPATVSGIEEEHPTNSPRFLGMFKGGTGSRGKQQQQQQLPDDSTGSSSTSNPFQGSNSATPVAAAAAAEEAAGSATAAGVAAAAAAVEAIGKEAGDGVSREGDRKLPVTGETTAAAVAAAVAAAAAEVVVESEGITPHPSSVKAPLKTTLSGGGGSNMNGVDAPREMTYKGSGTSGLCAEGKSNQTRPDYESSSGSGSGASSLGAREGGGVGSSRSGPGSRSTSPSRPAALSVGSDDGEEEHIYPASSQQDSRPSIEDFSSLRVLGKGSYGKVSKSYC